MKNADKPASPATGRSRYADGKVSDRDRTEHSDGKGNIFFPGLTKREYFAAMAMQGVLSNQRTVYGNTYDIVESSLSLADELLKQLES